MAAALDPLGRLVGTESFNADAGGYKALLSWLEEFVQVTKVGVEGTGSSGVGLSWFLRRKGVEVVEVNRPNRVDNARGEVLIGNQFSPGWIGAQENPPVPVSSIILSADMLCLPSFATVIPNPSTPEVPSAVLLPALDS